MSETNYHNKEKKKTKALFSVVCLCIVALGLIVYFSTSSKSAQKKNAVNENRTLEVTTDVQRAVTVRDTTKEETTKKETNNKKKTEKKTVSTTEKITMQEGKNNVPYKSFYKYPLTEAVVKGYSQELVYDSTMGDYRAHPAVDFKGSEGDEVVAINDGIVLDVYIDSMLGQVVVVDHGAKLTAMYCGLDSVAVKKGSTLNIGNKIGTLGKIPAESADSPHLHFVTTLDGAAVNPLDVMNKTE